MKEKIIHVAAAVIIRNGLVLASSRPAGKPHAGKWEFPGGKCEKGETLQETLQREMLEELEFPVSVGSELCHIKPAENLEIVFFLCSALTEKEPAILGNATFAIEESNTTIKTVSITAPALNQGFCAGDKFSFVAITSCDMILIYFFVPIL